LRSISAENREGRGLAALEAELHAEVSERGDHSLHPGEHRIDVPLRALVQTAIVEHGQVYHERTEGIAEVV
jgi:hypothetical protein